DAGLPRALFLVSRQADTSSWQLASGAPVAHAGQRPAPRPVQVSLPVRATADDSSAVGRHTSLAPGFHETLWWPPSAHSTRSFITSRAEGSRKARWSVPAGTGTPTRPARGAPAENDASLSGLLTSAVRLCRLVVSMLKPSCSSE